MSYELKPKTRNEFYLSKVAGENVDLSTLVPPVPVNEFEKALLNIDERIGNGGSSPPYLSLERVSRYLYNITFKEEPEPNNDDNDFGMCSSYVKDGKLYRNLDWGYSNTATFHVFLPDMDGIAFIGDLTDTNLDNDLIAQLPYRITDGVNEHGIMVSTHVLYNDWEAQGSGDIPLTRLPYLALKNIKSMATIVDDIGEFLDKLYVPQSMISNDYLLQVLVTDGTNSYVITPKTGSNLEYTIVSIDDNPKLSNFKWVNSETVSRTDLQKRPTGVERWNMMPCDLKDLRFTLTYESPDRLSEFIGIDDTDKDSTDEELEAIYDIAHEMYASRERDGSTWQTMHSVVYSPKGMEHLWIQENWDKDYVCTQSVSYGKPIPVMNVSYSQIISLDPIIVSATEEQKRFIEDNSIPIISFDATSIGMGFITALRNDVDDGIIKFRTASDVTIHEYVHYANVMHTGSVGCYHILYNTSNGDVTINRDRIEYLDPAVDGNETGTSDRFIIDIFGETLNFGNTYDDCITTFELSRDTDIQLINKLSLYVDLRMEKIVVELGTPNSDSDVGYDKVYRMPNGGRVVWNDTGHTSIDYVELEVTAYSSPPDYKCYNAIIRFKPAATQ